MKIYKGIFLSALLICGACGIKTPPIPRDSIKIPYPSAINITLRSDGVLIENGEDNYTMLVERADQTESFLATDIYRRLSLINPKNSYLDKDVKQGNIYTYRFRNFYPEYGTYSPAVTRSITYYAPVKLNDVEVDQYTNSACVRAELNAVTQYAVLWVNGKEEGRIEGGVACFDLPNSLIVNVFIIPYDFDGNPGIPYEETIKRDENMVLLPPQNARALREGSQIILTWDVAENIDNYSVYVREGQRLKLATKTDITLYRYRPRNMGECVNFELSSFRGSSESDRIKVTSCP